MPKVESYQKVKKEPGVGQRPANSKSLGAGIGRRPDKCDAGFPPIAGNHSASTEGKNLILCYLRIVDIFPLHLVQWDDVNEASRKQTLLCL